MRIRIATLLVWIKIETKAHENTHFIVIRMLLNATKTHIETH